MSDFSTYIVIKNNSSKDLIGGQSESSPKHGEWKKDNPVPVNIGKNEEAVIICKDLSGPAGSESHFSYTVGGGGTFKVAFCCAYRGSNYLSITNQSPLRYDFYTVAEKAYKSYKDWDGKTEKSGYVQEDGHPLSILIVLSDSSGTR